MGLLPSRQNSLEALPFISLQVTTDASTNTIYRVLNMWCRVGPRAQLLVYSLQRGTGTKEGSEMLVGFRALLFLNVLKAEGSWSVSGQPGDVLWAYDTGKDLVGSWWGKPWESVRWQMQTKAFWWTRPGNKYILFFTKYKTTFLRNSENVTAVTFFLKTSFYDFSHLCKLVLISILK